MALGKKKKHNEQMVQVPIAAMIDVVFLLLIYFILTHKEEVAEAHLAVNLPSPGRATEENKEKPKVIELEVHPGQVYLQKSARSLPEIKETLSYLASLDPSQTVMIKTSQMAKTEELVAVLDLCKGVGLTSLNLLTLK